MLAKEGALCTVCLRISVILHSSYKDGGLERFNGSSILELIGLISQNLHFLTV